MASEANEPGSERGKRSADRRGAARGTRAGSWTPQEGGASNHWAARLPPRSPGSFAAAAMITRTASYLARGRRCGDARLLRALDLPLQRHEPVEHALGSRRAAGGVD